MAKNILEDSPKPAQAYSKRADVYPKNMILYGPPGTGKTYQSVNYALAIIEGKNLAEIDRESRAELMKRFNSYKENRQIEFVTFHQSYAYEDFVQGLRPNTEAGTLLFEKRDGIFKRIADRAKKNYDNYTQQQKKPKIPFEDLLNLLLSKNINPDTEEIEFPLDKNHRIYKSIIIFDISEDALIYRRCTKNDIVKNEERKLLSSKLAALYEGKDIKEAINEKYYESVVEAVKTYEENLSAEVEEHHDLKNYVLILDEINRANISAVFGELITLIEEDKRYGAENQLQVSLPSGDIFTVPANLYLIGTMNTADKSIALLDMALRRRFVFEGFYPNEKLIENPKIREIFVKLNKAIFAEKKSADFLIGHTFLLHKNETDLEQIFNQQLIPLLEEYFPHHKDRLLKVLKEAGISVKEENYQIKYQG